MLFIWGGGVVTVLILFTVIGYVFVEGVRVVTWDFLTTRPLGGLSGEGGISTAIVTTLYLVGLTIAILVPPGIGAAIYLAEYSRDNLPTRIIRYAVETLAGVPSIVFGLFGFVVFVTILSFNFSILSGALTLACLLLPTLIRTAEEAIKAVPQGHRAAAMALGSTKWQTTWRVVLPSALPGIVTGIILCVGRSVEETACLYVTLGGSAAMPTDIFSGGRTLSLHLYYLATETNAMEKAMGTGVVLIATIVILNGITNLLSRRFRARLTGGSQ
jgi:phosphate transport system permease protein